jgi:hypothetical protein
MDPLRSTLETVKNALVGENLSGGLVQQVNNLNIRVANLITQGNEQKLQNKEKRENLLKWKLAAVGFAAVVIGYLLEFGLSHLAH